jgi:phosphoenolpyruvate carboxykinase (GTP)
MVNWFRKDENGRFVWPGYGENSRVLKWIFERLEGETGAVDTAIGRLPAAGSLDTVGLGLTDAQLKMLTTIDAEVWTEEASLIPAFFEKFGDRLPAKLWAEHEALTTRLAAGVKAEAVVAA